MVMPHDSVISIRTYIFVLVALVLMTFLTVGISFISLSTTWHVAIGMSIGTVKAALVVLFFMHVIHSPKLVWVILAVALLFLLILVSLTYTDYLTRGLIPGMPGH
jgi:cytochrome c oxidase subunit IV